MIPVETSRRRSLALLAAVLVTGVNGIGCAGSTAVPHNPPVNLGILRGAGSASVAVLPRPGGELVRLSLWIDAGSRDANPPQVATLAAWLAADASGSRVTAHVEPEGTELGMWCRKTELVRCLDALRRALALRKPGAAKTPGAGQLPATVRPSTATVGALSE